MKMRLASLLVIMIMALPVFLTIVGNTGIASCNQPPAPSFTYLPEFPQPEQAITFDASASYDPDGLIVQYAWDFGDGNVATSASPITAYTYPVDGTYTVELAVTDNNGLAGFSSAVIQVSTVTFFRVCFYGTLIPMSGVEVTAYYKSGSTWMKAPVGPHGFEIKYDLYTQPDLANTDEEKYRNPAYSAAILRKNASNVGFDLHPSGWTVYFEFKWDTYVAYWPNNTARVYTYKCGTIETHNYLPGHQAYWDPSAGTYVIRVGDIPGHGVSPTQDHPIIVGILSPPPPKNYHLSLRTDPAGITTIPGEGEYTQGTDATLTAPAYVDVSSDHRYRFSYWDVDGTSQGNGVNPITVHMSANHTATAHYLHQYSVTFSQTGLSSDATGTILTVDGASKSLGDLPLTKWVDSGSSVTYSYGSTVSSTASGKRYRLASVSGPASPISVTGPASLVGNYVNQYQVTFAQTGLESTATGTVVTVNGAPKTCNDLPYNAWFDSGTTISYTYSSTVSSSIAGKRFRLNSATGPSSPVTVTTSATVVGNYVVQYSVTFSQTGLDSTATGTVVTVNGDARTYAEMPATIWADSGTLITYSYNDVVLSTVTGKQFKRVSIAGPASPFTVTTSATVNGDYKTQYYVTFDQAGVGPDFTNTAVTIDSFGYGASGLPISFWWDKDSSHTFAFASPLVVDANKQYTWQSTSGLSSLKSGTLTITGSGSVTGTYIVAQRVTFDQVGASSDFTGTVLTVDGTFYGVGALPVSFTWNISSAHTFAFQSPLVVTASGKQYAWTSTTGLATLQSGSITVTAYGSIVGHYKTRFYLSLPTVPQGLTPPSGSGWYDAGTYASISTSPYQPGGSRYRFAGWTTDDMAEITDPSSPSTTVLVDKPKTVTANYVHQYMITFGQSGVGNDATGTVLTINGLPYTRTNLPVSTWFDEGTIVTYSYTDPIGGGGGTRYKLTSITGPISPITVTADASVTGNYQIQFQLTVSSPYGTPGGGGWFYNGETAHATLDADTITHPNATRHVFTNWNGDASGTNYAQSNPINMNGPKAAVALWKTQYHLTLATNPPAVNSPTGGGWYDVGASATVSADAFVDIVPGSSRYRFNGWTTDDMPEITDPTRSPTTVLVDKAKTVTANYATQYKIAFDQSGVGGDFTGQIVTIDGTGYVTGALPASFWWDNSTSHAFAFQSPLVAAPNVKRYVWLSTAGLSTLQSGSITVSGSGGVTGNYKIQYLLTVKTDPAGLSPQPTRNPAGEAGPVDGWWFDSSASVTLAANSVTGYTFHHWTVDGTSQGNGVSPVTFTMTAARTAIARYTAPQMLVEIDPLDKTIMLNGSVAFTSSVTGGAAPYTYQWYLNNNPVSGATSPTWVFDPASAGVFYVHLKVTDAHGNVTKSSTARIGVLSRSVGGYSVSLTKPLATLALFCYALFLAAFCAVVSLTRRKRK